MKVFALVPLLAAALAAPAATAKTSTGLYGLVTRGPITPMCVAEEPCSAPAPGAVLIFMRSGQEVARVKAGTSGRYRVHLAGGSYTVRALNKPVDPKRVVVRQGRMLRVDFSIDTGIR